MPDYEKMYGMLFNEITDVIERLKLIRQKTEDLYVNCRQLPETPVSDEKKPD